MIDCVILSKDRPAQLDLLIRSIRKNTPAHMFNIICLIIGSNEDYNDGYRKLYRKNNIYPVYQLGFEQDVLGILKHICKNEFMCFMTDDDIVYKNISENDMSDLEDSFSYSECFSLRLGQNTLMQDQYTCKYVDPPLSFREVDKNVMCWNHWDLPDDENNFGYPMSVDGHIFKRRMMVGFLNNCKFHNPNSMEAELCKFKRKIAPIMCSFTHSVLINSPNNRVADCNNSAGLIFPMDQKETNQRFLDGEEIDLESIDFEHIIGTHQELEMKYVHYPNN